MGLERETTNAIEKMAGQPLADREARKQALLVQTLPVGVIEFVVKASGIQKN